MPPLDKPVENQKHVLMIAYLYPPLDHTGVRRIVKFVKYLPEFGYKPVILTTQNYGALPDDPENLVFRTGDLLSHLKRLYQSLKTKHITDSPPQDVRLLAPDSPLERLKSTVMIPDGKIVWYPAAVRRGRQLIRSQPIRLLYSTSSPETDHLVALKLKQETGLPWLADFRDGWMFEPLISSRRASGFWSGLSARLEQKVILAADRLVTVNEIIANDIVRRYPESAAKVAVITNGYDSEDFSLLRRQVNQAQKFRVVYTGALLLSRAGTKITGLLAALQAIHQTPHPLRQDLEIVIVGHLTNPEVEAIEKSGLAHYFSLIKSVSYQKALQYQLDAEILLLVTPAEDIGVSTSKLFEYLATGRPILALTGQSAAAQIVTQMNAGLVVSPDDAVGIQQALQGFHQQWQAGHLPSQVNPCIHQFDRRELTRKLAALFDELDPR
jgi:glycosyltransferase involved in cell wall biosynthesis